MALNIRRAVKAVTDWYIRKMNVWQLVKEKAESHSRYAD